MKKQKKKPKTDNSIFYVGGNPDTAEETVNRYGTYEIQATADTENPYPAIAQGYNSKVYKKNKNTKS